MNSLKHLFDSGALAGALMAIVAILWGLTVFQNSLLFRRFRAKYPQVAAQEIPYAFSAAAHPEKAFYFFRQKAKVLLREDPEIWKQRQIFLFLIVASVVLPIVGFVPLFIYAVLHS